MRRIECAARAWARNAAGAWSANGLGRVLILAAIVVALLVVSSASAGITSSKGSRGSRGAAARAGAADRDPRNVPPRPLAPAAPLVGPGFADISNGTLRLGINPQGHLDAITDAGLVGLTYIPTAGDALSPGCSCEGWGVGDSANGFSGFASGDWAISSNLTVESFVVTSTTAESIVQIADQLRVRHYFHPSSQPELYQLDVRVENIGTTTRTLRYRRKMDWDVPPTEFDEFVTLQGAHPRLLDSTDDGFADVDPLQPLTDLGSRGTFSDVGPDDRGGAFDLSLGELPPGDSVSLTLFYGAAANESDALAALSAVGATLYSLGQPNTTDGPTLGTPNTFMFGVGPDAIEPSTGMPPEQMTGVQCGSPGTLGEAPCGEVAEPVNTVTGAFVHAETDLSLASTGVPFEWTRTYTSADTASGRFGQGWTDTYQASLQIQPSGDIVAKGDEAQRLVFTASGGGFEGAPGARSTLEAVAGGYRLTTNDQLVYEFDSAGKLLSKEDRNGQGVTLSYDGSGRLQTVTDSAGQTATVSYSASNLVSGVSLSDGRSVSYGYTNGQLTSFTEVRGKTWQYTYEAGGRLATIVDPLGHTQVQNVYDQTSGRVTQQTNATGDTTGFAWDEATETATITDPRGHVWKDVYVDGLLSKRIDGTGKTTELGFDADLNNSSVKSPAGETTTMSYDGDGNLLSATAPASLGNAQKTFVYNARNDPTSVTDARGTVTSYTYTTAGNVETVTQGGQQQAAYTYDSAGRVLTASDARGNTTTYTYDAAGNVASVTRPDADGPGPLGLPKTTFTYDGQGNVLTRVDPKGNVPGCGCAGQYTTTFTYDAAGNQLTETDPLGHVTTNAYDDAGRLVSTTDASGHTTAFSYDDANRVLTETEPDPDGAGPLAAPVTTYTYDDAGNKLTETDPRGNATTYAYDHANRLVSTSAPDPDGAGAAAAPVTSYAYDANGNLASTVEPRGNLAGANPADYRTNYAYDAAGRLLSTTDPLGHATTSAYDAVGNLSSVTDANGHVTAYTYDYAGRVLTVTAPDPDGAGPLVAPVTSYSYDPAGNRLTRTDANGHVTSWAYDALDRPVSETTPDPDGAGGATSSVDTMAYDLNGNLLSATDANGNGTPTAGDGTTSYAYDRVDRMTGIDYSDTTPDVTFGYDSVGNRVSMTDGSGTQTRSYDNLDRVVSETRGSEVFAYAYDAAGNVTKRTYPDGSVVDYTFDPLGRMSTVANAGRTVSYAYDAASNLVTTTLPSFNQFVETRTYDRAGRLVELKNARPPGVLSDYVWQLDPVGNPLSETDTGANPSTRGFTYDQMDRLTGVCFQTGGCPGGADPFIRWSYDGVGNRLTQQRPAGSTAYTYDAMDRMLTAGGTAFTYDRDGNRLTAGTRTFTWDLAGRLVSTHVPGQTSSYTYDGDGNRLKSVDGGGAFNTTLYQWDLNRPLPMLARESIGTGTLHRRYVNGLRPLWWTTDEDNSSAYYFHRDPLGSIRGISSKGGGTTATYDYEPYGTLRSQTGTIANPNRFAGYYHDTETGLYYLHARQYDPTSGTFLSVDPVTGFILGARASSYAYASVRPTVLTDPSGERPEESGAFEDSTDEAISVEEWGFRSLQSRQRYGNGCGPSGWRSRFVLDRFPLSFDFRDACERHDLCYGTWGKFRFPCDVDFRTDFRGECSDISWNPIQTLQTPTCFVASEVYYEVVRKFGRGPFTNAQLEKCPFGTTSVMRVRNSCLRSIRRRDH